MYGDEIVSFQEEWALKDRFDLQAAEPKPFIAELLSTLTSIIQDLQLHQIHMFYEAVGLMISSEREPTVREAYLVYL